MVTYPLILRIAVWNSEMHTYIVSRNVRSFCPSVLGTTEEKFELSFCLLSDTYDHKTQC